MVWLEDVHDPFYQEEDAKVKSYGRREQVTPLTLEKTMRSFNEGLIKDQGEENKINVASLQSIRDIQQKAQWGSNPNCVDRSRSVGSHSRSLS